ncbi:MAG TPA: SIS domain-containing protein [Dongiaceae bacterium]
MSSHVQDRQFLTDYFDRLVRVNQLSDDLAGKIYAARDIFLAARDNGGRVAVIGNGGSAGIAAHIAIDLAKNGNVPALCFNDGAQITCLANDYGFENWLAHAVRLNLRAGDVLVAISSSGKSRNILEAVKKAQELGLKVVTLSGFAPDNPLRQMGDVNFWADSKAYNIVETAHQFWLMSVIDLIIGKAEYSAN